MNLKELIEKYPNDSELGSKLREIYWNNKEEFIQLTNQFKKIIK